MALLRDAAVVALTTQYRFSVPQYVNIKADVAIAAASLFRHIKAFLPYVFQSDSDLHRFSDPDIPTEQETPPILEKVRLERPRFERWKQPLMPELERLPLLPVGASCALQPAAYNGFVAEAKTSPSLILPFPEERSRADKPIREQ